MLKNGVSLVGRWWHAFRCLLGLYQTMHVGFYFWVRAEVRQFNIVSNIKPCIIGVN